VRIAASNIAWDVAEDEAVAALLKRHGVDAIDVAPGKYFHEPKRATAEEMTQVREAWAARGIALTGMQALLFGTQGLNLFGPAPVQNAMLEHLDAVCRIGAGLGATRLVFGSPKNRDRTGLNDAEAEDAAVPFFRRLGDLAAAHGVLICLEPNPSRYGANFMINSTETAAVVERVAHPAIRMQLDTGALTLNGEEPEAVLERCAPLIGHVHASEPDLVPLGNGTTDHAKVAAVLRRRLPHQVVSIEMVATQDEPHLASLERAVAIAVHHYRDGAEGLA
jgi:D-psicose/D-tagatose/L-ribulose 3-epimerase